MYNNNIDGDRGVNEGEGNGLDHVEDLLELALIWRVSPTVANFISRHTYTHLDLIILSCCFGKNKFMCKNVLVFVLRCVGSHKYKPFD